MPSYKVEWSPNQKPWVMHTPEKTVEFVRGLLCQAVDVGGQITINVIPLQADVVSHVPGENTVGAVDGEG